MAEEDRNLSMPSTSAAVPVEEDGDIEEDEDGDEEMILVCLSSLIHCHLN